MKRFVKKLANSMGIKIVRQLSPKARVPPALMDFLRSRSVVTVYDVGANTGQYAIGLRQRGYRGRIISFEPVREVFLTLEKAAKSDTTWITHNLALGAEAGIATINVTQGTEFSSMLPISEAALRHSADATVVRVDPITVATLDSLADRDDLDRAFLKIDAQGFEEKVLAGSSDILEKFAGVQLELPVEHMYNGDWSLSEALRYMADRGFVPSQIYPMNRLAYDPVSIIEVDCIFRRADSRSA